MITFEIGDKEYKMPSGWNEVSLDMFRKIQRHSTGLSKYKSQTQFALEMMGILLGDAPTSDLLKLDRESYMVLSEKCEWVNTEMQSSKKERFEIEGEVYLPVKNLNKLSMGDSISLELMVNESDEIDLLPNILPIILRKARTKLEGGKEVEVPGDFDADNYEETKNLFLKNIMITEVMHISSFFFNGENQSSITMKASLEKGKQKKMTMKK